MGANEACVTLFHQLGSRQGIIFARDGSFALDSGRTGWGFAVYKGGQKIMEDCGAHHLATSSTRMEVEAVRQALMWLAIHQPQAESVIIATDSEALLARIKSGWLPDGWIPPSEAPVMSRIVWVYVPGHAGVVINEEADRLAAAAKDASPLTLYHSDIQLLGEHLIRSNTTASLQDSSEGIRLLGSGAS